MTETSNWRARNSDLPPAPKALPRLVWEILSARGIVQAEAIEKWLKPTLKDLRDPSLLTDMDKATRRLLEARLKQEHVVIYADYDLDGTSACALLLKAFAWMGFEHVSYYQPKRLTEGYGLHNHAIEALRQAGNTLLVSVDLGITAIEQVALASQLGLDCIITDHHLPKETLPEALAVVNPNRGNCTSGLEHLCGTGVAFYLVLSLRRALLEQDVPMEAFDPKELLDCFAIGTLTDMVPLIGENRVLVKHGLKQLAQTKRPGLRVLMQALGLWGNPLTSQDVAIRFAPKLNALSRMETGILPIDLYLAETENDAHALVERVLSNNQDRQATQKSAEAEAFEFCRLNEPKSSIFVFSENFHRGVVGLVATKLCQEYGLPTFVGSLDPEHGQIVGSARMPDGRGLNALDAMADAASVLEQFGGHAMAAGFELKVANAEAFRSGLEQFFAERMVQVQSKVWLYDAVADLSDLSPDFMNWYEHLSPFGAQFSVPVFCLRSVRIDEVKALKGGHFRLTLASGSQATNQERRVALWFSPLKNHPLLGLVADSRPSDLAKTPVDALVEPQWNYFNGKRTLQLLIQDLRLAEGVS